MRPSQAPNDRRADVVRFAEKMELISDCTKRESIPFIKHIASQMTVEYAAQMFKNALAEGYDY